LLKRAAILSAVTILLKASNVVLTTRRMQGIKGRLDFSVVARLASYLATAFSLPKLLIKQYNTLKKGRNT
jgi:hypothetical protein